MIAEIGLFQATWKTPGRHSDLSEIKELIHSGQYVATNNG